MAKRPSTPPATAPAERDGPFWLVCGDEYLVARHARELANRLCPPDRQALGLEVIEGRSHNKHADLAIRAVQQCRSALNTVGFFGGAKTIWLRDVDFFFDGVVGRQVAVKEEVALLVADLKRGLLDGQQLVLSATKVDRRSALFKTCQTLGTVREFALPDKPWEREKYAREVLRTMAEEVGLEAGGPVLDAFIGKAGTETLALHAEIEKLKTYLGDRKKITEEDVRLVVSPGREAAGWDLSDALGERNLDKTIETYRQLVFQGEEPFVLLMGLHTRIRELLVLRICLDQGWLRTHGEPPWLKAEWLGAGEAEPLFAALPEGLRPAALNPWRAGRLAAQALKYTRAELTRAQHLLLETHAAILQAAAGPAPKLLVEVGLIQILKGKSDAA